MTTKRYPQFILLGDSIVQNSSFLRDGFSFGAALEEPRNDFLTFQDCQRRLDVINRGLSGYNTANALVVLEDLIPSPSCAKVDYLLILFGANDACLPEARSGQHVPLQNYIENLKTILTHPSVTAHNPTVLLVTPPLINETHLEQEDLKKGNLALTRHQAITAQYAEAVRSVAAEHKDVILVDLWTAMVKSATMLTPDYVENENETTLLGTLASGDNQGLKRLLVDGLHLTGAGYKVFSDEVLPSVGKDWATEPFDNPSWVFPHWTIAPRIDKGPKS